MKVYLGPYKTWRWYHRWLSKCGKPGEKVAQWLYGDRKTKIKIHDYDTWSMDYTLSLLVVPMLKQLKATKHGIPSEAFEGDPFTTYENDEDSKKAYAAAEARWNLMLDKMIWAHEQIISDDAYHDDFYITKPGPMEFVPDKAEGGTIQFNPPGQMNWDAYLAYQDRIDEGLKLFGEHYRSLWD